MKAEQNGTIVNLRAENPDEQRLLDAFWERGARVCAGGSRLGISLPGFYYVLELNEEQVMALMHLLGSGRQQERDLVAGAMINKSSLCLEDETISLGRQYQSILEEVIRSMKRRDGGATMGFPTRMVQRNPQPTPPLGPAIIAEDRLKQGPHTVVSVSIHPDTSGDYVIMGENSEAVLKAVGEYLLATKEPKEE